MKNKSLLVVVSLAACIITPTSVYADAMSPSIKDTGKTYSKEHADYEYYGTGIGGRAMEASMLRFQIDRLIQDGMYEKAMVKARKACQLDPSDPENHLLLARAVTKRLASLTGPVNEKLLAEAMTEWKLIWMHDADNTEQSEAKYNYVHLKRVAMGIEKKKKMEAKEREKAKHALAQDRADEAKHAVAEAADDAKDAKAESAETTKKQAQADTGRKQAQANADKEPVEESAAKEPDEKASADTAQNVQIAHKRKRFGLF